MFRVMLMVIATALVAAMPGDDWTGMVHSERTSPGDLELGGDLAGVPAGETRYVRYEDLLRMPQETYAVSDDSNFRGKTEISGVALSTLAQTMGKSADMIVAICYDQYRANYPKDYVAAHHPLLVLRINGQDREHWPATAEGGSMAPYVISHPKFKPAFKVLSHEDEAQIPYGVTRLEFRREAEVFGAIRPPGQWTTNSPVGMGYVIARQDCFRCHNMGAEGGTMARRSWVELAKMAHVKDGAKMPGQPGYDDATLDALTEYFKTFTRTGDEDAPEKSTK
jgi:hypothetical protein